MQIVITGGAGFLGQRLTAALLRRGHVRDIRGDERAIERITILDVGTAPAYAYADPRVRSVRGDVDDKRLLDDVITPETSIVFHLAAIVSGMAEAEFDLGMRINLDATRRLLEVCRARGHRPAFIFTSSVAVYGGVLPAVVLDTTAVSPQSSYGSQKAIGELLVNDFSRRGFVDGRVLRLPTVSIRPGRPNAAASSFASGILREPLNGEEAVCPVDKQMRIWLISPAVAVACLMTGADVRSEALGTNRTINLPGLSVTVGEMADALGRLAGPDVAARIRWARDERIERIVATWPGAWNTDRARTLGFPADENIDALIRQHIEHELKGVVK